MNPSPNTYYLLCVGTNFLASLISCLLIYEIRIATTLLQGCYEDEMNRVLTH